MRSLLPKLRRPTLFRARSLASSHLVQNGASFETMVCFNRRRVVFQDIDVFDHAAIKGETSRRYDLLFNIFTHGVVLLLHC